MNTDIFEKVWDTNVVYTRIAHALARGYTDLYYVNMDTDEFIEFHTDDNSGVLSKARYGTDFFEGCERDAKLFVHSDDQELFVNAMNRAFLREALEKERVFILTYRRIKDGTAFYVEMKVTRMDDDPRIVVIAVSNIDELVRQRRANEKTREERIIYARLHALTGNMICIYLVDPKTNSYREFSASDSYEKSFAQAKEGTNFFHTVRVAAHEYNDPTDLTRFLSVFTKENILESIEKCGLFTMEYNLLMNGKPFHVQMNAAMVEEEEGPRLIVGVYDNDAQYRQKELNQEIARQKEIYDQITASLAEQYDTLYYIDIDTNTYVEISSTDEYKKLNVPATGNDFFAESRRSIRKYVHPEDQEKALSLHYKDVMLENLKYRNSYSVAYRLVVNGQVKHIRHTEILAKDEKHILVCIENIDAEVEAQLAMKAARKKSVTFTQIAETLADHYDLIYYVDCSNAHYAELATKNKSGELKVQDEGTDFFEAARINADRLIHSEDRERIRLFLDRDHLLSSLENRRQLTQDYRMIIDGGKTQYTRMTVTYSIDRTQVSICVENREKDVRREQEHLSALSRANELARRDELTHTKNMTAFHEMEKELQQQMKENTEPFGIVVCDINGLKIINDTEGHKAGDDYIRSSCRLICRIFAHSPVFRIGGDEFAVVLKDQDYRNREILLSRLRKQVEENMRMNEGPVVASGMAVLLPQEDISVEDVFNRADTEMYADKSRLKEQKLIQESHTLMEKAAFRVISDERRIMLDTLYRAFEVVAEGTYVYLCDMKYDFSRWSKNAVDTFGLPSEYMYGAGDIWENQIHPEDRASYHKSIDELFAGNTLGHDMQYRARRVSGEYDVCTCRGIVIRDAGGEPDYFVGTIRNHGIQGHIDTLTGLLNQYGFFEHLDACIKRNAEISVMMFGISRFSEINDMYGYRFGNRVLQTYARALIERFGSTGHVYRIDGTKFAFISNILSIAELKKKYDSFREFLHEQFTTDGKSILLDLHCGAIRVADFNVDSKTIYACLNYAYTESFLRRQGELVEFRNELSDDSFKKLEKLHAIRASIMHGFQGFYLLFQPVVDARTEKLIGAESLLRWKNDLYGMVPPDQFIPVLESDPLFPDLGEWILRESLISAKQVLERHPGFVVNVNLSYTQLEKPDFVDMVLSVLQDIGYPPELLCLEVTERCRLLDLELLKNVLTSLKSYGIQIALDDFGTGFSSLNILREIPIDIIKIDRGFVCEIENNEVDRMIVGTVANLANIFGSKVCVEGIETEGMRDILRLYTVSSFQGYFYGKPNPPEQLFTWK